MSTLFLRWLPVVIVPSIAWAAEPAARPKQDANGNPIRYAATGHASNYDEAANFPWWLTAPFQKYAGRWNDFPVDSHLLIALSAPRPVFLTGGTQDQWADPKGEFLALVAAGPVYQLLGQKDLGTTTLPALDQPQISGNLGFHYHTGGHTITPEDWSAFLEFAGRTLRPVRR